MNNDLQQVIADIKERLTSMEENGEDMNSVSWGYQEGVLLSGNQAKAILDYFEPKKRYFFIYYWSYEGVGTRLIETFNFNIRETEKAIEKEHGWQCVVIKNFIELSKQDADAFFKTNKTS